MSSKRSSFSGGLGFVLAAAGSAVGLGNLWRFPYLAAQYGGGIFILVYLVLALTFGFALLSTEIAIGRKTGSSPILAYKKLDKRFSFLGYVALIVPVIIVPYYCVIGGWVTKYITVYAMGLSSRAAEDNYYSDFISSHWSPLVFFAIFMLLTILVVLLGVEKGIEKMSKLLMPVLILLTLGISIYIAALPGAVDGIKYYLIPDFDRFSFMTVVSALGQLFFSVSIAMGIMITYGSYTNRDVNLSKSVSTIELFDTFVALLSGLTVVPAVFIFGGEEGLSSSGPGLMFQTLPKVFVEMPGGSIIGFLFFLLVFLAALTSSISVTEAIVSSVIDGFGISRAKAGCVVAVICILLGVPSSLGNGVWSNVKILGMDFLSFFDYLSNSVLMPIIALVTCIMIGWFVGTKTITDEITKNGEVFKRKSLYNAMIKYIAPVLLIIILVISALSQFGILNI